jgi:hypothetical protein
MILVVNAIRNDLVRLMRPVCGLVTYPFRRSIEPSQRVYSGCDAAFRAEAEGCRAARASDPPSSVMSSTFGQAALTTNPNVFHPYL